VQRVRQQVQRVRQQVQRVRGCVLHMLRPPRLTSSLRVQCFSIFTSTASTALSTMLRTTMTTEMANLEGQQAVRPC
jgi:hypothetical protein